MCQHATLKNIIHLKTIALYLVLLTYTLDTFCSAHHLLRQPVPVYSLHCITGSSHQSLLQEPATLYSFLVCLRNRTYISHLEQTVQQAK